MDAPPPAHLMMSLIVIAFLLLPSSAMFFAARVIDPIGPLAQQALTIQVVVFPVVCDVFREKPGARE